MINGGQKEGSLSTYGLIVCRSSPVVPQTNCWSKARGEERRAGCWVGQSPPMVALSRAHTVGPTLGRAAVCLLLQAHTGEASLSGGAWP